MCAPSLPSFQPVLVQSLHNFAVTHHKPALAKRWHTQPSCANWFDWNICSRQTVLEAWILLPSEPWHSPGEIHCNKDLGSSRGIWSQQMIVGMPSMSMWATCNCDPYCQQPEQTRRYGSPDFYSDWLVHWVATQELLLIAEFPDLQTPFGLVKL